MAIYTIPNTTEGYDNILIDIVDQVPSFTVMLTIFVVFFVAVVGMSLQQRRSGITDAPLWITMGLLSGTFLNLIFSMTGGVANPIILGVVLALTLFSALWLFLSKSRFESQ